MPGETNAISVMVESAPDAGGGYHRYALTGFDTKTNPMRFDNKGYAASFSRQVILFQNGPVLEAGPNGVTIESLLAVCSHRLDGFQNGLYASADNHDALVHINKAIELLQKRTAKRLARGVAGTPTA